MIVDGVSGCDCDDVDDDDDNNNDEQTTRPSAYNNQPLESNFSKCLEIKSIDDSNVLTDPAATHRRGPSANNRDALDSRLVDVDVDDVVVFDVDNSGVLVDLIRIGGKQSRSPNTAV